MKKQEQLYIKEGNRYKPFTPPQPNDNTLYRKYGNKYVDVGTDIDHNRLTEGVWVVCKMRSSTSFTPLDHLRTEYRIERVSDLHNPLLQLDASQLGAVNRLMEDAYFNHIHEGRSPLDLFKIACSEVIYELTKTKI